MPDNNVRGKVHARIQKIFQGGGTVITKNLDKQKIMKFLIEIDNKMKCKCITVVVS